MAKENLNNRGDETRNLLLETGLRLFSLYGFDSVSTRQLTRESGTNIAAINYHFGGKKGLYQAVLHQLVEDTEPRFGPGLSTVQQHITDAGDDRTKLSAAIKMLVANLLRTFIEDEFMRWRAPLVMREYANPSEDFDILYKGRIEPLHKTITKIVATVLGKTDDNQECIIRAHTIMGQIVVFGIARVVLWKRLDWDGYSPDGVSEITNIITHSILGSIGLNISTDGDLKKGN